MDLALRYAARSNLGLGPKSRNEDSGYAGPHLLVLADGMGGHAAGDVASSMVVGALAHLDEEKLTSDQALSALEDSLRHANRDLSEAMAENASLSGMGTTTIAMLRTGNQVAMAHIGDSRGYLLRDGVLTQITKDHSLVQTLLDEGRISAAEAEHHPQRSLVTRVMTGHPYDTPDLSVRELIPGDRYVLCSDGLSDFVTGDTIAEVITSAPSPAVAADRCIEIALRASARDNITVVVADVVDLDALDATDPHGAPTTVPEVVGAAAARGTGPATRPIPVGPAAKAAALTREATGRATEPDDDAALPDHPDDNRTPRRTKVVRALGASVAALLVILGGGYATYMWTQNQYFIAPNGAYVAIFRGVPQVVGPLELSAVARDSEVLIRELPAAYQVAVNGRITTAGFEEAEDRIRTLRGVAEICREQTAAGEECTAVVDFERPDATLPTPTSSATSPGETPFSTAQTP